MPSAARDGLDWDESGFEIRPRWTREPQLDAVARVCRAVLALAPEDSCRVAFHAQGAFNKLYSVDTSRGRSLMRVSLPVDPGQKTRGEVTTLRWLRRVTHVPVPKVIAFDDSQNNEIGFEWILMELMPGESAYKKWRKMSISDKEWLVEQVADFQSQIFRRSLEDAKFHAIGTLDLADNASHPARVSPKPGRIVNTLFFLGDHFNYDVPRGPFRSSHDWLSAQLSIIQQEQIEILKNEEEDEDVREEAEDLLEVAKRLTALLPKIFPPLQYPEERTALWHGDLSLQNILVDDDAKITAIIDWECVSCEPLWIVTRTPKFLLGRTREEEPVRERYADASDDGKGDDDLDNEGKTELYWINLMEYEQTRLRGVYTAKLKELWPPWETEVTYGALKADFWGAVVRCASGWHLGRIERWIDAVEAGGFPRLMDILESKNSN